MCIAGSPLKLTSMLYNWGWSQRYFLMGFFFFLFAKIRRPKNPDRPIMAAGLGVFFLSERIWCTLVTHIYMYTWIVHRRSYGKYKNVRICARTWSIWRIDSQFPWAGFRQMVRVMNFCRINQKQKFAEETCSKQQHQQQHQIQIRTCSKFCLIISVNPLQQQQQQPTRWLECTRHAWPSYVLSNGPVCKKHSSCQHPPKCR